jgi:RNA methyltransferase, TrmH family
MITSLDNERVKRVKALQSRSRARRNDERFVIEGLKLVQEAVNAEAEVDEAFYTEDFAGTDEGRAMLDRLSGLGASLMAVDDPVMKAMSDTPAPQGVLAVLPTLKLEAPEDATFALIIDGVSDPGNMGTIMRAAAAAGVPVMYIAAGAVDITNPKVLRSGMGAHFRLPVKYASWDGIANQLEDHVIFLAEAEGGAPYFNVDWTQPSALIVSEEAHGASADAIRIAHARITIPMPGGMESLNVAMATSVMLFEMVRQRFGGGG